MKTSVLVSPVVAQLANARSLRDRWLGSSPGLELFSNDTVMVSVSPSQVTSETGARVSENKCVQCLKQEQKH